MSTIDDFIDIGHSDDKKFQKPNTKDKLTNKNKINREISVQSKS